MQRLQLKISLTQEIGTQVQTVPNRINPRRYTKRQIFIKLKKKKKGSKVKAAKTDKGISIRLSADFLQKLGKTGGMAGHI